MNKNRFNYIVILVLLFSVSAAAQSVTKNEALKFTSNWVKCNSALLGFNTLHNFSVSDEIIEVKNRNNITVAYGINLIPRGFLFISANKKFNPVIGYSDKGKIKSETFFRKSNFVFNFIENNARLNRMLLKSNSVNQKIISHNLEVWAKYLKNISNPISIQDSKTIYGPFLNSDWGQGYVHGDPVFNYYSPNNWPTGCVATAMAQILNYYKWPVRGLGSHGYTDNNTGYQYADFYNTFYDWENTLDQYQNALITTAQQQAAGLLTYHTAVSLNMDFEANGSTASTSDAPNAFTSYFRFSGHYKSSTSSGFWDELKANMIDGRPGIISITGTGIGHAAVVDGYSDVNNYYHVNPGWYGDYTGWYNISGSWNMSGYNNVVGAVKGIVPSPMINIDIQRIDSLSFIISWMRSRYENADFYELQQSTNSGGPWTTLSSSIPDSFYTVTVTSLRSYYYRVRANRDGIWWNYSYPKKVTLGTNLTVTFIVDMSGEQLSDEDEIVIRGNIPPLSGSVNSAPMQDADGDNIYELPITFDFDEAGSELTYRFFIQKPNQLIAENENRYYTLTMDANQVLDTAIFNNFSSIDETNNIVSGFSLSQNYPNPFFKGSTGNGTTSIKYSLPAVKSANSLNVQLVVFDILGRKIATIVNKNQMPGNYEVNFNPDNAENNLPAGIYFYRLTYGKLQITKKMVLMK